MHIAHSQREKLARVIRGASRLVATGACLVSLPACSQSPASKTAVETPAPAAGEPTSPETASERTSIVCGTSTAPDGQTEPELYMLTGMNNKLARFPDFATYFGAEHVTDCAGARGFMRAYRDYFVAHPRFDAQQPLGTILRPQVAPPATPAKVERQKMANGDNSMNNPVVKLQFTRANGAVDTCSGTFIAKNWILTAAHCMTVTAVDHCLKPTDNEVNPDTCTPNWFNWSNWDITFPFSSVPVRFGAVVYVHPDWTGRDLSMNLDLIEHPTTDQEEAIRAVTSNDDLALLYIGDDSSLPGDVEQDGAMRLSLSNAQASWQFQFFGWGKPDFVEKQSRTNSNINYQVFLQTISGTVNDTAASELCKGDSGGPLVRRMTVSTNTGTRQVQALVGVASIGLGGDCISAVPDTTMVWTRVDNQLDFIEGSLRDFYLSTFNCTHRSSTTDALDELAECWGAPCTTLDACGDAPNFCSEPGLNYKVCPTCPGASDCSCIVGQCLVGPPLPGAGGAGNE